MWGKVFLLIGLIIAALIVAPVFLDLLRGRQDTVPAAQ